MDTSTARTSKPRLWTGLFFRIGFVSLVFNGAVGMLYSAFPLYLKNMNLSATQIGMVASLYTVAAMFTRFGAGSLVDSIGRRKVGLLGVLLFATPVLGFMWGPALGLLILFRMVQGSGASSATICIGTMVADILPQERFAEGIGYYGLFVSAAGAVAPALGISLVAKPGGDMKLFYITLLCMALAFLLLFSVNYEKKGMGKSAPAAPAAATEAAAPEAATPESTFFLWKFFEKDALPSAFISFVCSVGGSCVNLFLAVYAMGMGIANVGLFFTVQAICMFVTRILSGNLAQRVGTVKVLVVGIFLMGSSIGVISFMNGMPLLMVAGVLMGCGGGLSMPILNVLAVQNAAPSRRGKATSTYYAAFDIGGGVGSLLYGLLADSIGYASMYRIGAVIVCANAFLAIFVLRKKNMAKK